MTRNRPEARLQKAVVQHLMLLARPGVIWFSIPNEGKRSVRTAMELKRMGMRPGIADLCIVVNGKAHFLELKAKGGKLSADQIGFFFQCGGSGVPYKLASDIDRALSILREWGAIKEAMA